MSALTSYILTAAAPAWFAGAVLQVINGPNEIRDSIAEIRASLISMKRMDAKVSLILFSYAIADSLVEGVEHSL
jgi:hypothetical protein